MSDSDDSPFNMGDKVSPKTLGFPGVGLIVGAISGVIYPYFTDDLMVRVWNKKYPSWQDKYIFLVLFQEDRKPCRFDEFKEVLNGMEINKLHYDHLGTTKLVAYPEDDLELFDKWDDFKDEK